MNPGAARLKLWFLSSVMYLVAAAMSLQVAQLCLGLLTVKTQGVLHSVGATQARGGSHPLYSLSVRYTYAVDGQDYASTRYSSPEVRLDRATVQSVETALATGGTVDVHRNRFFPGFAVLDRTRPLRNVLVQVAVGAFIICAALLARLELRSQRRPKHPRSVERTSAS
jgi:hypothetical protein